MRYFVMVLALFLAGCAATSQKDMANMADIWVCSQYGQARTNMFFTKGQEEAYRQELVRRDVFTAKEWQLINAKKIQKGMSLCGLRASWGPSKDREYVGKYSKSIQHSYTCKVCHYPHAYVYTEGGVITGWSN